MKAFVVFAAALAAAQAGPSLEASALHAKWTAYKAEHGKQYAVHEEQARKNTYLDNIRAIEEHNARFRQGLETFEMAHNELADLSLDEIVNTRMGVKMPADVHELMANASLHVPSSGYQHPAQLDWTVWGGVQRVKNQGSCGSCYTFSAAGAIETAQWRKTQRLPDVSEQHMVDCTRAYGNGGCGGGWMHTAFKWLLDNNGFVAQSNYPYTASVGNCQHASKPKAGQLAKYVRLPAGDERVLLDAVATTGSVSIAYNAGTTQHAYYKSGVLDVPNCGNQPTHAVLLVGYGTDNGVDYWKLKNSWGTGWGEQGFFRMKRGVNMCGIADWASYPIV